MNEAMLNLCFTVLGGCGGWLLCWYFTRKDCLKSYDVLARVVLEVSSEFLALLNEFKAAATPVVSKLEVIGDDEDWENANETSRVYQWYEIQPLKECLDRLQEIKND